MTYSDAIQDEDGASPIETLEAWFDAHGWSNERLGDEEIVAGCDGSWGPYELRGVWREEDRVLQFIGFPDIKVRESQYPAIYETIGLINEQLWLGHFELWSAGGSVVFRHAALLEGVEDAVLTLEQADALIDAAVGEIDRFYPVFQFVLWGGKTPSEAIAAAMVETQGEA